MRRPRRIAPAWPGGLIGRVMLVLLAAVVLEGAAGAVVYEQFELHRADEARATLVADRLTVARRVISAAEPGRRPALAEAFSTPDLQVAWSPARDGVSGPPARFGIARRLRELTDIGGGALQLAVDRGRGGRDVVGAVDTAGGGGLRFRLTSVPDERAFLLRGVLSAALIAAGVLAAALMLIHVLTTPLRHLTAVVDSLDPAQDASLLEGGPKEVRDLARAFNDMQARIGGMVADRTRSLAAISHDLRTPLARIRLRAGFMPDAEARAGVEADVAEMEAMIDTVLAYVRGETDTDPPELVDLGSLLLTVAEDAQDLGADVVYEGPPHLAATLRRMGMKRAVTNLVDNARRYARVIRVRLEATAAELRIVVEDDGPGIPEAVLPRITEPFFRIEADRSRGSGGAGLGLPIARTAAERDGGRLLIGNRAEGGLRCEIVLPRG